MFAGRVKRINPQFKRSVRWHQFDQIAFGQVFAGQETLLQDQTLIRQCCGMVCVTAVGVANSSVERYAKIDLLAALGAACAAS